MYDETRQFYIKNPDGTKSAYSTLSYANGPGFYDHFTNETGRPWKNISDYNDPQYRAPAMAFTMNGDEPYESHGGEDVPILASGPWAHLFVGVHEQSYFCQAIEHAAGWKLSGQDRLHSTWLVMLLGLQMTLA